MIRFQTHIVENILLLDSEPLARLTDRTKFPYFWRTAAPDQPEVLAQVAVELGFTRVALMVSSYGLNWLGPAVAGLRKNNLTTVGTPLRKHIASMDVAGINGFYLKERAIPNAREMAQDFLGSPARLVIVLGSLGFGSLDP